MEDYVVLIKGNLRDLEIEINAYLKKGFLLSGGVSTAHGKSTGNWGEYGTEYSSQGTPSVTVRFMQAIYRPTVIKVKKTYIEEN